MFTNVIITKYIRMYAYLGSNWFPFQINLLKYILKTESALHICSDNVRFDFGRTTQSRSTLRTIDVGARHHQIAISCALDTALYIRYKEDTHLIAEYVEWWRLWTRGIAVEARLGKTLIGLGENTRNCIACTFFFNRDSTRRKPRRWRAYTCSKRTPRWPRSRHLPSLPVPGVTWLTRARAWRVHTNEA